jgi:mannonate dehydratase
MTNRRDFMALSGTLGALLATPQSARATVHASAPGIKLCAQSGATPTDEQLLFLKQIGAEYVSVASTPDLRTAEGFLSRSRSDTRMPASPCGTSATPVFTICPR